MFWAPGVGPGAGAVVFGSVIRAAGGFHYAPAQFSVRNQDYAIFLDSGNLKLNLPFD